MDDFLKPKEQLVEELQDLREQIKQLQVCESEHQRIEQDLQATLLDLRIHQEELETQNDELRTARHQLELSQKKYFHLFDFAPIGYFTVNKDTLVKEVNLTGAEMLGYQRHYLVGKPLFLRVAPAFRNALASHLRGVFNGENATAEVVFLHQNGHAFHVMLQSTLVSKRNNADSYCLTAAIDISGRKRAEEALQESNHRLGETLTELRSTQQQVLQQERLAAVGQLAAGIAHDFNNILTSIQGFAELLTLQPNMSPSARSSLVRIIEQSERAAHLIRQVLDFSRKSIRQPKLIDLAPLLKEVGKLLKRTIPENIHIQLEVGPGQYLVNADPTQLQQLLTNLAVNARDAMSPGGQLRLGVSGLTLEPDQPLPCGGMIPGDWIALSIIDTGIGIPFEIQSRIFEPFFTTKDVGQGTGLGLAQVYGIVKQHDGFIKLDSQVGEGTQFIIYLPTAKVETYTPIEEPINEVPLGHGETVLLVEDEPMVLKTGQALLEHLEYRVLTAINGEEALMIYTEHKDEIALVLADMVMPHMGGVELFQGLRLQNPGVKMVMLTGYPLGDEVLKIRDNNQIGWVQKPIRLKQLADVVNRALNSKILPVNS